MTNNIKPSIDILSLFPQTVRSVLDSSILRRAQLKGEVELLARDLRDYSQDKYHSVDDSPFGGEQGMLFSPEIVDRAFEAQVAEVGSRENLKIIYPSPRGAQFNQTWASQLAEWLGQSKKISTARRIAILCGRYEGIDERINQKWVDLEISMGDFIVTGGELPALTLTDSIVRLLPGVLKDERSHREESFSDGLLEYPQYTKPREIWGLKVPEELLSGHHKNIKRWKIVQSLHMSFCFRPDLIDAHSGDGLEPWAQELLGHFKKRLEQRRPF